MTGDVFYKATRLDGTDFRTGTVDYAAAVGGEPITPELGDEMGGFPGPGWLHLATVPTACVGMMSWPCRLFEVAPVGDVYRDDEHPHKIGCRSVRVLREVDAHLVFGPQGRAVAALIDRAGRAVAIWAAVRLTTSGVESAAAADAEDAAVRAWMAADDAWQASRRSVS